MNRCPRLLVLYCSAPSLDQPFETRVEHQQCTRIEGHPRGEHRFEEVR